MLRIVVARLSISVLENCSEYSSRYFCSRYSKGFHESHLSHLAVILYTMLTNSLRTSWSQKQGVLWSKSRILRGHRGQSWIHFRSMSINRINFGLMTGWSIIGGARRWNGTHGTFSWPQTWWAWRGCLKSKSVWFHIINHLFTRIR